MAQALSGGGEGIPDGLHLYSISAYAAYSSTTIPFGAANVLGPTLPGSGVVPGPNYLAGVLASVGWRKSGARTNTYITYTPSYDASLRFSSANSLNHYLNFGVTHDLGPRWTFLAGGTAVSAQWNQFLFEPTVLGSLTQVPATFDDFMKALLGGQYTNGQLASILTGAPALESPASTLLFGTRLFSSSLRTSVMYQRSPRLQFRWELNGRRTQHLKSGETNTNEVFLVPETTSVGALAGVGYSISPVTQLDFEVSSNRMFSRYEDAYVSNASGSISRVLGRRWIAQLRGGAGMIVPVRHTFAYKPGPHYLAGATLTYKTLSHTFMGSFDRTITDSYGLGAYSASVASGAWSWRIPGRGWSVYSAGRYEMLENLANHNLNAWLASVGISRRFDRHTIGRIGYIYGRNAGFYGGGAMNRHFEGVQLVVSWSPQEPFAF
jgi:hypothetical protein